MTRSIKDTPLRPCVDWQALRKLGFSFFPLPAGEKKPATSWKRFQSEHASDEEFRTWQAASMNAAIVTGEISGLVVIDCDSPEAVSEIDRLGTNGAPRVDTARGAHFYFRHPGRVVKNATGIRSGVDVRGDGGYVVAPGSIHPSGTFYRWHGKPPVSVADLPPLPDWLRKNSEANKSAPPVHTPSPAFQNADSKSGLDSEIPGTAYGKAALIAELQKMRSAVEGTRNSQLNKSAFALAQLTAGGEIDEDHAYNELFEAALDAGLAENEIENTIESGWSKGEQQPRSAPEKPVSKKSRTSLYSNIITAPDLVAQQFSPLAWALPALLPEGLALLAGKPKSGKSYLSLQLAIAVASGNGSSLGIDDFEPHGVLYCALEDSRRSLQRRIRKLCPFGQPERLHLATEWPRIGQGGIEQLDAVCDAHPDIRLIIIDTLRTIKASAKGNRSAYDQDVESVAPLLEFVHRHPGCTCLVIHHTRKMTSDDPFDLISGTHGLTGVFDTLMVLSRSGPTHGLLVAQGRELEPYEKILQRNITNGGWIIVGDTEFTASTPERQQILEMMRGAQSPMTLGEVAARIDKAKDTTRHQLKGLIKEGFVQQPKRGSYELVNSSLPSETYMNLETCRDLEKEWQVSVPDCAPWSPPEDLSETGQ